MSTSTRSPITTHILDTALGRPAAGVPVSLERLEVASDGGSTWRRLDRQATDDDGRVGSLGGLDDFRTGRYRLLFDLESYREGSFFPEAILIFRVDETSEHYHVPLLLSPFGFTTYRGS